MRRIILAVAALSFVFVCARMSSAADELSGTYVNRENKSEYITFSSNKTFHLKQKKPYDLEHPYQTIEGTYTTSGDSVTLKLPDGGESSGKILENAFIDSEGRPWVKEGAKQKMDTEIRPKRYK